MNPSGALLHGPFRTVLIVDDEESVRSLLARWLEAIGVRIVTATDADSAMNAFVSSAPPDLMVCDIRMPGHDGLWLAARVRQQFPETAVIMASGVQDEKTAAECQRNGVVDYLTKPFGRDRLREAVRRGFEWHDTAGEARRWRLQLEMETAQRTDGLLRTIRHLSIDSEQDLAALLAVALNERDAYAHAHRVRHLAVATAVKMECPPEDLEVLARAALLHDIGKAALPVAILRKPAALTAEEMALMRTYPSLGETLLGQVPFLEAAASVVRDAHERMDGTGYPRGVHASSVSLAARILGVADAYDTMTHPRVFRDSIPQAEALLEIERCSGSQFDADVVGAFTSVVSALASHVSISQ